ncbi:nuclear transport factor 2 family protein [Streptomyces sp. NPDC000594]|uniref:nuclear transport factor 2 family protein n=1 Tax=Streptomyces sp. NPDC000594 TaxID=3154261 RepID=UPI00332DFA39
MTQRVDLARMMDRLAVDELVTGYAVAVDDADRKNLAALFTQDAVLDYRDAGGTAAPIAEAAEEIVRAMALFPVRQHLIVNRLVRIDELDGSPGDTAEVRADYLIPMARETGEGRISGGRYVFTAVRAGDGWLLSGLTARERWHREGVLPGPHAG